MIPSMRSGRFIAACLLLLSAFMAQGQIKLKTYTTATDTFYWKRYVQIPAPPKVRPGSLTVPGRDHTAERFLSTHLAQFPQYTTDSLPGLTPATLKKCLYPVDINGDRLTDILFSGDDGTGSGLVRIYLNRPDTFELVFEDYQYLSKWTREGGKLSGLVTGDVGRKDDCIYFTREYRVEWENGLPLFVKVRQTVDYRHTEEPSRYYASPVRFEAAADTMMLRASAACLNEPFMPALGTFGNIIAKYRSRAAGQVLAVKSNGKGDDWYFVEISPGSMPSASLFYGLDRMPSFIRGWVSGQAILRELK